jgi:ubiquinone/menaquinone biosynthesis C-methylase UbiE
MPTFWDRVAHLYDATLSSLNWTGKQLAVADGVSGCVLEACCGTAALAFALRQRGLDVYAIDLSPRMLAQARSRFVQTGEDAPKLAQADVTHLPFPDRAFDYVIVTGALGLFPADLKRDALHELVRVCRGEVRLLEPLEEKEGFYGRRLLTLCVDGMRPIPRAILEELGLVYREEWRTLWEIFSYVRIVCQASGKCYSLG